MSPCLAVPWFPACGSTVLVKVDAVPHASRVPCQELVVPHLAPGRKFLEPLGVAEPADQVVLRNLSDTGFEFIHSGMTARQKEKQDAARKKEAPFKEACHRHDGKQQAITIVDESCDVGERKSSGRQGREGFVSGISQRRSRRNSKLRVACQTQLDGLLAPRRQITSITG